jgi:hypothetical protein
VDERVLHALCALAVMVIDDGALAIGAHKRANACCSFAAHFILEAAAAANGGRGGGPGGDWGIVGCLGGSRFWEGG